MSNDEKLVIAALKAAAEACMKTCGQWRHVKTANGEREFECPCAVAIMKISPQSLLSKE